MIVAGYYGDSRTFFELERRWCAELRTHPKIAYFKGSECKTDSRPKLTGEFAGWSPSDAAAKRLRLAKIINDLSPELVAISSRISWDEYRSVIGDQFVKSVLHHPYFFCFHGVITLSLQYALNEPPENKVAFVLDVESNGSVDEDARVQFDMALAKSRIPQEIKNRMGSVTQDSDIRFPALQAADMLAWSLRREAEGLDSPVLELVRYKRRLFAFNERNPIPSAVAQFVVDLDEKAARMQCF